LQELLQHLLHPTRLLLWLLWLLPLPLHYAKGRLLLLLLNTTTRLLPSWRRCTSLSCGSLCRGLSRLQGTACLTRHWQHRLRCLLLRLLLLLLLCQA
jgi:hypothetical protein